MKFMPLGLRTVVYAVVSLACAGFALADDWTCTQPPTANIGKGVEKLPGTKHFGSIDRRIVDLVENPLKKRLGFKSDIVSCQGSSCRIGKEFIRFIDGKIELPTQDMPMSICWVHNPHIAYCDKVACSAPPDTHYVAYIWDDGGLSISLMKVRSGENQLHVDRFNGDDYPYDAKDKDFYSRSIGVARDLILSIDVNTYYER